MEITPKSVWLRRREFLKLGAGSAMVLGAWPFGKAEVKHGPKLAGVKPTKYDPHEEKTKFEDITTYNNFYELGTDKEDPSRNAARLDTSGWKLSVEGEVGKPKTWSIDELTKAFGVEERVYRLRCVEAWSMVIPWDGFPLADFLKRHEPTSRAKYVSFVSAVQPSMPGVGRSGISFPYKEGLRIDEAMHPLAFLAVGLYGETLPNQDGAPIRLVVPWKYGFKSAKSLVKIRLQETQPSTTWSEIQGGEYGFYANVNPTVDHPRWSQSKERRIGETLRRKTLMFNGYDEVAPLYAGMDLAKFY